MKEQIDITEFIPRGRKNSVSRWTLRHMVNMNDRKTRRAIEKARETVPIVSREDGGGYFLPTSAPDDLEELRAYIGREQKRAYSCLKGLKAAKVALMDLAEAAENAD